MRRARWVRAVVALWCAAWLVFALADWRGAEAQISTAQLVGRAVLPAASLKDGPVAGTALAPGGALINGVKVPFDGQPVGNISAALPGDYSGTWLALSDGRFDEASNSADYLLSVYTLELDWRRANSGSGGVNILDWLNLSDPRSLIGKNIVNDDKTRQLTGADLTPRAIQRTPDGSLWVADAQGPWLLRFDSSGRLRQKPFALDGGNVVGLGIVPDQSALVVAMRSSRQVRFQLFDVATSRFDNLSAAYRLDSTNFGGMAMINNDEALVVEHDSLQGQRARVKRLYVFNIRGGNKTLVADLLNIDDPNRISEADVFEGLTGLFGLGASFRMPFTEINTVYPLNENTVLVANNNHLPYGLGRSADTADATEFIAIQLSQPLALDPAFRR